MSPGSDVYRTDKEDDVDTWLQPELMLDAAIELDRVRKLPQTERAAIRKLADLLHAEFCKMWTREWRPSKLELDVLPAWAKQRGMRKMLTIYDVQKLLSDEVRNLLWIHAYGPFGNFDDGIQRAKDFCLYLNQAALTYIVEKGRRRIG